jgi:hypothetical protein
MAFAWLAFWAPWAVVTGWLVAKLIIGIIHG